MGAVIGAPGNSPAPSLAGHARVFLASLSLSLCLLLLPSPPVQLPLACYFYAHWTRGRMKIRRYSSIFDSRSGRQSWTKKKRSGSRANREEERRPFNRSSSIQFVPQLKGYRGGGGGGDQCFFRFSHRNASSTRRK